MDLSGGSYGSILNETDVLAVQRVHAGLLRNNDKIHVRDGQADCIASVGKNFLSEGIIPSIIVGWGVGRL